MTRVVILSGSGRYTDRWHSFPDTSEALRGVLRPLADEVVTVPTEPDALPELATADLLVVNSGPGDRDTAGPPRWAAAHAALAAYCAGPRPVLAVHTAADTFHDVPAWHERLAVRWVSGRSFHPPRGRADVRVPATGHPVTAGHTDFTTDDERYCDLVVADGATALADHTHDGTAHPLLLVRDGREQRTVYSALGHDARAYRSPELAALLRRAAAWALGRPASPAR